MKTVRLLESLSGPENKGGGAYHQPGDIIAVEDAVADELVKGKLAVAVTLKTDPAVEGQREADIARMDPGSARAAATLARAASDEANLAAAKADAIADDAEDFADRVDARDKPKPKAEPKTEKE